jgi:hypothetical protein
LLQAKIIHDQTVSILLLQAAAVAVDAQAVAVARVAI